MVLDNTGMAALLYEKAVAMSHSTWASIDQSRNPLDHVAARDLEDRCVWHPDLRFF